MANFHYKTISAFFETMRHYFPVIVKRILLLEPSKWVNKAFSLIGPNAGQKFMSKIAHVTFDELLKYVDKENLVAELGGSQQFDMGQWIRSRYEIEQVEYRP